ncbi:MAG: hypothetical protein ACK40M_12760 [Flavobacteriales bacterium]
MKQFIYFLRQIKYNRSKGARWSDLRYFFRYRKYTREGTNSIKEELPWLSFRAVDFLLTEIPADATVFEWGGGGSTTFFNGKVKTLVTVEHNEQWFNWLKEHLSTRLKMEWNPFFIAAGNGNLMADPDPSEPGHYASGDDNSIGFNFKEYVTAIDQFPDQQFDLILVDGRARTSCIHHAVSKLKTGGLLVVDNAEREYYTEKNPELRSRFEVCVHGMGPVLYSRDFSETRIYRKLK